MEYPSYGIYRGSPSEERILEDAEAVYRFVREELRVSASDIVLVGRSLGSGPAVHLASEHEVFGMVLVSAFTSIADVATDKFSPLLSWIVRQRFNNLAKIARVRCPVSFVHGLKDQMVAVDHCRQLMRSLP